MPELWKQALRLIENRQPATLVTVVDGVGSVPGKPGAKMVVSPLEGVGTVGGGVAENEMCARARAISEPTLLTFNHAGQDAQSFCAGVQTFALLPLTASDSGVLSTIVTTLNEDGCGALRLSGAGLSFTAGEQTPSCLEKHGDKWTFCETLGKLDTLFVVGGGHVSLALSRVMATLPFRIVVLDDREGLPTMQENVFAHSTRVIAFADVADHVLEGERSFAVIMTYGHSDDQDVLERLVGLRLRYLGMMGSAAKVRQIFANLERKGVPRAQLERVHSPVGLAIASHTPAEIAISIAAEIIRTRNKGGP